MSRVSASQVREIVPTLDASVSDAVIDNFIITGSMIVDEELSDSGHSEIRLEQIELYLSAHFAAITYTRAKMEKAGSVSETVMEKVDLNFNVTLYGQQAVILDTSGALANMQKTAEDGVSKYSFASVDWEVGETDKGTM